MRNRKLVSIVLLVSAVITTYAGLAYAKSSGETGKLKVHVEPKQAYLFVDGKAVREGSRTLKLEAGDHKLGVYNYGYLPNTQNVQVTAGQTVDRNVALQVSGDKVKGPFAEIEFKGPRRAAVLLNGQTPAYFVGHVDEFDWDWLWHQRLLVKPGTYQVTVTREGNTIWSGPVTAKAGQHVTVYLNRNGQMKTQAWKTGLAMGALPRFRAGIANTTVAVAPVTSQLSAQMRNLSCGQSTFLNWKSLNAADTTISGLGAVGAQGQRAVKPTRDMTYTLTAKGPGGVSTQTIKIDVNTQPAATLALSEPEVHYHKIGDKVVEQDSATLNWSASNASSATVEPFGSVATSGSRTVEADPKQAHTGPVSEDVTYTLNASNACGGTATKTAVLHVVGSIDPPPAVNLASLFYPTAFPTRRHPKAGLVASERRDLTALANHFSNLLQYDQDARLVIVGHADVRGPRAYNRALSERRAKLIRAFLVSKGVPSEKIQTRAMGKTQQLSEVQVEALQSKDTEKPEKWERRSKRTTWLAYNRRADIILEPKGQQSAEAYPNDIASVRILWQRPMPSLKRVESAAKPSAQNGSLRASLDRNR